MILSLDREKLLAMAEEARRAAKIDADKTVAKAIVALIEK